MSKKPLDPMIIDIEPEYLPKDWARNIMNKIIWGSNEAYYDGPHKKLVAKYEKQINEIDTPKSSNNTNQRA